MPSLEVRGLAIAYGDEPFCNRIEPNVPARISTSGRPMIESTSPSAGGSRSPFSLRASSAATSISCGTATLIRLPIHTGSFGTFPSSTTASSQIPTKWALLASGRLATA